MTLPKKTVKEITELFKAGYEIAQVAKTFKIDYKTAKKYAGGYTYLTEKKGEIPPPQPTQTKQREQETRSAKSYVGYTPSEHQRNKYFVPPLERSNSGIDLPPKPQDPFERDLRVFELIQKIKNPKKQQPQPIEVKPEVKAETKPNLYLETNRALREFTMLRDAPRPSTPVPVQNDHPETWNAAFNAMGEAYIANVVDQANKKIPSLWETLYNDPGIKDTIPLFFEAFSMLMRPKKPKRKYIPLARVIENKKE